MRIDSETSPSEETLAAVRAGMRRYTESQVPWDEYTDLALVARADDGTVIAAALGETGRGWLHVSVVWVDERARRQQLGTKLMNAMEAEAIRRGCRARTWILSATRRARFTRSSAIKYSARWTTIQPVTSGSTCVSGWARHNQPLQRTGGRHGSGDSSGGRPPPGR